MITKGEIQSQLKMFFPKNSEVVFLRKQCKKIQKFIYSRREYITQSDMHLFLTTEAPIFIELLSEDNLSRFIDLCYLICM